MKYTKLGNTGLDVSKICLGCMSFGEPERGYPSWSLPKDPSREVIRRALDLGINFFDTANVYSDGSSEEILGQALKDFAKREEVVIATKVCLAAGEGPNRKGLSRKHIFTEIERSLKRLQTDYIDLYIIHRWDEDTPIEETMEALNDLVRSGKVRYIGCSSCNAWQFAKAQYIAEQRGWTRFVSMQNKYNLLYREEEREQIPQLIDMHTAMTPYQPLAGGRLSRKDGEVTERSKTQTKHATAEALYSDGCEDEISRRVEELSEKYNVSKADIALAWELSKSYITSVIVGTSSPARLDDTVKVFDVSLTSEDIQYLEEPYIPHYLRF
jgi:aryl-alcohol dehydrogenase-like predicted oxidoreductase